MDLGEIIERIGSDSDEHAWMFYQQFYGDRLKKEKDEYVYCDRKRNIAVNGDVCFNIKLKNGGRYSLFGNVIKDVEIFCELKRILDRLLYSPMNISIMPQTGGLNIIKQNFGSDRFDSFMWVLGQYYYGYKVPILNGGAQNMGIENRKILQDFLDNFSGINEYGLSFYGIDESLINRLIINGRDAIVTPKDYYNYLELAVEFWNERLSIINDKRCIIIYKPILYKLREILSISKGNIEERK